MSEEEEEEEQQKKQKTTVESYYFKRKEPVANTLINWFHHNSIFRPKNVLYINRPTPTQTEKGEVTKQPAPEEPKIDIHEFLHTNQEIVMKEVKKIIKSKLKGEKEMKQLVLVFPSEEDFAEDIVKLTKEWLFVESRCSIMHTTESPVIMDENDVTSYSAYLVELLPATMTVC